MLFFSSTARAIDIGEAVLQSRLGEPLHAVVELVPGKGEQIESACLSLIGPAPQEGKVRDYLIRAKLAIKAAGGRQYVDISTPEPFFDSFVNLRLKIKCPGMGVIIKTLTILPEHKVNTSPVAVAPPAITGTPQENTAPRNIPVAANIPQHAIVAAPEAELKPRIELPPGEAPPRQNLRKVDRKKVATLAEKPQTLQAVTKKPGAAEPFMLKLSTELIDESRIGKLSVEERESLREQQKALDEDDQAVRYMALQQQLIKMLEELDGIKLRLARLSANEPLSPVTTPTLAGSPPLHAVESHIGPVVPEPDKTSSSSASQFDLPEIVYLIAGLLVVGLSMVLGLRFFTRRKSRQKAGDATQQINKVRADPTVAAAPVNTPKPVTPVNTPKPVIPENIPKPAVPTNKPRLVAPANKPQLIAPSNSPPHVVPSVLAPKDSLPEDDLIMEEAELYAIHGHPDKAVNILKEMIERSPTNPKARRLLLSIYSSVGKAAEFEQAALDFQRLNPGSTSWRGIQALGRTLDINNPLYADATPMQAQAMRRPIGEILVKMGALSVQDMKHCLAEFDPKKHGRFGGYLITRKVITLAQLDRALLKQQNVNSETSMPTLEEKPLDFEFDALSDKAQVMDLDFESLSEQPKSFDINIESPADAPQSQDIASQPAAPHRP